MDDQNITDELLLTELIYCYFTWLRTLYILRNIRCLGMLSSGINNGPEWCRRRLVHVGGMRARRDWYWELTEVGRYSDSNFTLVKPLWPSRPRNFHRGDIPIAFSQVRNYGASSFPGMDICQQPLSVYLSMSFHLHKHSD